MSGLVAGTSTTPGRLRLLRTAIVALAALLAVIGTYAATQATAGTDAITEESEPLVVDAVAIYSAIARANTVAAQAFLSGGLEPAAQVERYDAAVREAGRLLADSATRVRSSGSSAEAITTLTEQLPVYTSLIASARANNRQGLPVGSAYLTEADHLARTLLLPAADRLLAEERHHLAVDYSAAKAHSLFVLAAGLALALAGVLGITQRFLFHRTQRILNAGLLASSVVLLLLVATVGTTVLLQQARFADARREGTDPLDRAAHARIAALMQKSDEILILVSRSESAEFEADFQAGVARLLGTGGKPGLLRPGGAAEEAAEAYVADHAQMMEMLADGDHSGAVGLATSSDGSAFETLDEVTANEVSQAEQRFTDEIGNTEMLLSVMVVLIPIGCILIGVLAVVGIRPRLEEYR